jgi:hypothetical protein
MIKSLFVIYSILVSGIFHCQQNVELKTRDYSLIDFGAKGDGKSDDSFALQKALEIVSKTNAKKLIIPNDYIFNLNSKSIDLDKFSSGIILDFQGGYFKNGQLNGNKTIIKAERIKIFDNIKLSGTFFSALDYAYPEWYGCFPNDITLDVVDALKQLDSVFFDISLGAGDYFTRKGEYQIKGLKGVSMAKSRLILDTDKSYTYILSMGKIGGGVTDRTYDYNYLKDITLVVISSNKKRLKGNKGLIIGAVHKPIVENVKIFQLSDYQMFIKKDLEDFVNNNIKSSEANVGVEFNGDSEVSNILNLFTLGDVGILFSTFTDFVNISNYMNWSGKYGLANVYYRSQALSSQNILFSGSQSWNQGLYGLYAESTKSYNSFPNVKFENLRIEQLTSEIKFKDKLQGANIWIGENETISNLQLNNIMLSGTSNGIHIGNTSYGKISLENFLTWSDKSIKKEYALDINFKNSDAPLIVYLRNISLQPDAESYFRNGTLISNEIEQNSTIDTKNFYSNHTVISQPKVFKKTSHTNQYSSFSQLINVSKNNIDFIPLNNSKKDDIIHNKKTILYSVELFSDETYDKFEFVIYKSGKIEIINQGKKSIFAIDSVIKENKLTFLQDKDSGVIFLYNRLGKDCVVDIQSRILDS